jgi:chromosome partitioning protein
MGTVIAWGNQKGGVGKSTSCAATSFMLANKGYKVLAIDCDPQGNLVSIITGKGKEDFKDFNLMVAIEEGDQDSHIVELSSNLHIIPANRYLANFNDYTKEQFPDDEFEQSQVLRNFIEPLKPGYDFIMLDLPPALERLTINGLAAADYTVALLQPVPLCFDAINEYIDTVESLKDGVNEDLDVIGVLMTLVDREQNVDKQFIDLAKEIYGDLLFKSVVYRRTRIKQYPSVGLQFDSFVDRSALRPYQELTKELLTRVR